MYEQMICQKKVHMKARLFVRLQTKRLTGESHFTLAYIEGWTYGWAVGRSYSDVKTKISRMDGLPYFLSNGAPLKKKKKKKRTAEQAPHSANPQNFVLPFPRNRFIPTNTLST